MELNLDGLLVRMWDMMALVSFLNDPEDLHPGCKYCQGLYVPIQCKGAGHIKLHEDFKGCSG